MNILAADDEPLALEILSRAITQAQPDAHLTAFSTVSAIRAALNAGTLKPDVAFLDIEMPGIDGLELARLLRDALPRLNLIFVTGYEQYALEAFSLLASGYIVKPVTKEKIAEQLCHLRFMPKPPPKRVRVQCFGSFEVFVDGAPLPFLRSRSKELLAYLVDRRGVSCSAQRIAAVLWEDGVYDRARQKQLSVIRADLIKSLRAVDANILRIETRDALAVEPHAFDCDYYRALDGDPDARQAFLGEYMAEYAWAELTAGALTQALAMTAPPRAPSPEIF